MNGIRIKKKILECAVDVVQLIGIDREKLTGIKNMDVVMNGTLRF
jgi:hypothetical protein